MEREKKVNSFLDGFLYIYRDKENLNKFGAKISNNSLKDKTLIHKLAYTETFKRYQDYELANASNSELTLKVKTHLVKDILSTDKVVINNIIYSILYLDEDKTHRVLYIYLEEDGVASE